jgi:hypothetical protein
MGIDTEGQKAHVNKNKNIPQGVTEHAHTDRTHTSDTL